MAEPNNNNTHDNDRTHEYVNFAGLITKSSQHYFNLSNNVDSDKDVLRESLKKLRESYLEVFEQQDLYHKEEPYWWKKQFIMASELYLNNIKENYPAKQQLTNWSFTVYFENKKYEFTNHNIKENLILLGVKEGCDIKANNTSISRLHAMIFYIPLIQKIVVLDPGSFYGINTLSRSTNQPLIHSLPNKRDILVFDIEEIAILQLYNSKLVLNVKDCLICMENIRECILPCNHYVSCQKCVTKLKECPICRKDFSRFERNLGVTTHVVKKTD